MNKFFSSICQKLRLTGSQMILGLSAVVLGLILLIAPGIATSLVFNGIGCICIIIGIFNLIRYFTLNAKEAIMSNALAAGIIMIIFGLAIILLKETLMSIIPIFFGVTILIGGIGKLQGAMSFRKMHAARWYVELIFACISILFGALILFNPFSTAMLLMRIIGIALLIEGLTDMISISALQKSKVRYIEVELKDAD